MSIPNTPSTLLTTMSPISHASYESFQDEIAEARTEYAQLLTTLKTRAKTATVTSFCLLPITIPMTALLGCIGIACSGDSCRPRLYEEIWNWSPCTANEGQTGQEAGTKCPGISPCTPCHVQTDEGLIYSLATEEEKRRIADLRAIIG